MKDDKQNFVLFAVIAALILFGWPLIQGKFFPTANPPVTRIEGGKTKAVANPAADPAADGAAAIGDRNAVIAEHPAYPHRDPARVRFDQPEGRADRRSRAQGL